METINYQTLQETLYYEEMANGLKVYLLPKKGFSKTYGLFSTHFGSVDTTFVPLGENEMITVPDGIAHFLEHKMFEMQDGDASEKFAQLGASTNAFTSSSRTAYLSNTTSHENECVELLLDFVQDIYLTDQTVEKEKGIINQEIGMYDDDPDWRCYFGSIQNLYQKHPVKIDIAGTVETVNEIDKDILEKQKLVEAINLIENINNDDLNLDEKWDKLKVYLELIKNQGREIGTQLLEIIVLMAK